MQSPDGTRGDLNGLQHNPFGLRDPIATDLPARSAVLRQGSAIWYASGRKQEMEPPGSQSKQVRC